MTTIPYTRQLGFFDPTAHANAHATVVGLGGIGSFTAVSLAKLGVPQLTLIDFDTVEAHNVPNQFFSTDQIGLPKSLAIADICEQYGQINTSPRVESFNDAIRDDYRHTPLIVSGVDSMQARSDIWSDIRLKPRTKLYLDARIAGQLMMVYAVNPMDPVDVERYERTLHSDEDAVPAPCTERGVIDVGMVIGGILTRLTRAFYNDDPIDSITMLNIDTLQLSKGDWVL
jgi:molybdopterin/thiamine biosynthesis adenylyltransferase